MEPGANSSELSPLALAKGQRSSRRLREKLTWQGSMEEQINQTIPMPRLHDGWLCGAWDVLGNAGRRVETVLGQTVDVIEHSALVIAHGAARRCCGGGTACSAAGRRGGGAGREVDVEEAAVGKVGRERHAQQARLVSRVR